MTIPQRHLGGDAKDIAVGAIGHGLMGLTWTPNVVPDEPAFESIKCAVDAGANFLNTGQFYGQDHDPTANLKLLKRFFNKYPDYVNKVVLSVKGGMAEGGLHHGPDSTLDNLRRDLKGIIAELGDKKSIDIYEPARVDPKMKIEDIAQNLATLKNEGLFKYVGLSEIAASAVRKVHAIVPVAAVEIEVSLWAEKEAYKVIDAAKELDIAIIAYSPLGRGFLSGKFKSKDDLPKGDMRSHTPMFQPENWEKNKALVDTLHELAKKRGCTAAQLALAWVLSLSDKIIPIPGSSSVERIHENTESANLKLEPDDKKALDKLVAETNTAGGRYPEGLSMLNWGEGKLE